MTEEFTFSFTLPEQAPGKSLSREKAETLLLEKLRTAGEGRETALWEIARFYSVVGPPEKALPYLRELGEHTGDPEKLAACYLAMGQLMEKTRDFLLATRFYRQAFTLEPSDSQNWYFINNNLGFCLNILGQYREAEAYCRAAIEIDPDRPNAYKNLGLSLQGQERYVQAAAAFVQAVQANASDPRALAHLEALFAEHREIAGGFEDFEGLLRCSRDAVRVAQEAWRAKGNGGKAFFACE
jgi:tetratricopeptide (TPR) repeat protein